MRPACRLHPDGNRSSHQSRAASRRTLVLLALASEVENTLRDLCELPMIDRYCLEEFGMSKDEVLSRSSLRRCTLAIIMCTSVWWTSAGAHAQEAAATASRMTAHSTSWSLEGPGSNMAPHLVIGMADPNDTQLYGSHRMASSKVSSASSNTVCKQANQAGSANCAENGESGVLLLTSVCEPTAGIRGLTNFRAEPAVKCQAIEASPDQAGAKVYSLLDDRSATGSFLYGYQATYLQSNQWLADSESFTHEGGQAPRPLFEVEFGGWRLPVLLSSTAASQ